MSVWRPGWLAALAVAMTPVAGRPRGVWKKAEGKKSGSKGKRAERRRAKDARKQNR